MLSHEIVTGGVVNIRTVNKATAVIFSLRWLGLVTCIVPSLLALPTANFGIEHRLIGRKHRRPKI